MKSKAVSGTVLTLLFIAVLTSIVNNESATAETMILHDTDLTTQKNENIINQVEPEPSYVGIAKYYDDRKSAVTCSLDDMAYNTSVWQNAISMLTNKKIYHTLGIITNSCTIPTEWNFVQYWLNQGYTEAGSHSRTHVHAPYTGTDPYDGRPRIGYGWQINGSRNDIIGNLTLPDWWKSGGREYVYAWIEPYGSSDNTVRQWLGDTYYLTDRLVGTNIYDFSAWDSQNELFNRIGYTVEIGSAPWGGVTSLSVLNSKFDTAYNNGKIYHLMTHPSYVNWTEGAYADQHTAYIANRKDVWYVPFGLLYLYHWVQVRNIVDVTSSGSGQDEIFEISINEANHLNYGVSYPITYVFDIPSDWSSGYVYYRYLESEPWKLMVNKSSEEFYNGVDASRFNFTTHKAYVSIGFRSTSHNIYLQLRSTPKSSPIPATVDFQPSDLNLRNKAEWITAYIELPEGYNIHNVNVSSVKLNDTISPDAETPIAIGDYDDDAIPDLMVQFNRAEVTLYIYDVQKIKYGNATLTITGQLIDGTLFEANSPITVMLGGDVNNNRLIDIFDLVFITHASGTNSSYPHGTGWNQWNPDADINLDGEVDVLDLAISGSNYGTTIP